MHLSFEKTTIFSGFQQIIPSVRAAKSIMVYYDMSKTSILADMEKVLTQMDEQRLTFASTSGKIMHRLLMPPFQDGNLSFAQVNA